MAKDSNNGNKSGGRGNGNLRGTFDHKEVRNKVEERRTTVTDTVPVPPPPKKD